MAGNGGGGGGVVGAAHPRSESVGGLTEQPGSVVVAGGTEGIFAAAALKG
jgi:hypothetical protein